MNIFSENLKFLREKYGITQSELAQAIQTSRSSIASYEQGWGRPSQKNLIKIAEYFNVSVDTLNGLTVLEETKELINSSNKDFDIYKYLKILLSMLDNDGKVLKFKDHEITTVQKEYIKRSLDLINTTISNLYSN